MRILKYKCLILDHDDTVVKSTPEIHYPSMLETLKTLRPDMENLTLEDFVGYCFNPGFSAFLKDILKFNKEEQEHQYKVWKTHTNVKIPDFYPGFPELIKEFKESGGIVCVASHSEGEMIARDYNRRCGMIPDLIFGWELGEERRKPRPFPVMEVIRLFDLDKKDILVLDDLKPGLDMAKSASVKFAAAGWSHIVPAVKSYMMVNSDYYFETVESFKEFIFSE